MKWFKKMRRRHAKRKQCAAVSHRCDECPYGLPLWDDIIYKGHYCKFDKTLEKDPSKDVWRMIFR